MEGSNILWIVLGIVVLLAIAAAIYFATRKEEDTGRTTPKSTRGAVTSRTDSLQRGDAKSTDATGRRAKAETDSKTAATRRTRERAQQGEETTAASRDEAQGRLRRADKTDPDRDRREE